MIDNLEKRLKKIRSVVDLIDALRSELDRANTELSKIQSESADIRRRLERIEQQDEANGVVPHRWRACVTHDAPEAIQ